MEEQKAVVPVGAVRERVIQALTEAFANDVISVAELEDRLEKVYRATSAAEAEALIVGLRPAGQPAAMVAGAASAAPAPDEGDRERFTSLFSSQSRRGVWSVPRELDVSALFSDTTLDFTHATLPRDIVEVHVSVIFANLKIVVPAGLRVVNRVGAFMANVESEAALDLAPMVPGSPVIRITGNAVFANIEIVSSPAPGSLKR
jgi:hypothetical protein